MKTTDVVVVGGSAAGLTAAITARRHYPAKSVLVIRREKKVSIPCGIPYAFGVVGTPEKNLMPADESLAKNGIETGSHIPIGGQVTGAKSGGELINAISACIHQRMTADDIATFQTGTHPALTASPIAYQLVNAAETAIGEIRKRKGA
jgi:NADH oxidase (H2O2-forming)